MTSLSDSIAVQGDRRSGVRVAAAFIFYLAASIAGFGLTVIRDPARTYVGYLTDPPFFMWCIAWWPYAISHRLNLFLTKIIWAPFGYNLAWATGVPGLSLLVFPITNYFGVVVSYNLLSLLAPAFDATAAFLLCACFSKRFVPALVGGYIFGFSPFIVGHLLAGHLCLTFVPWVPFALYLIVGFLDNAIGPALFATLLVMVAVLQLLTSSEVFVTSAIVGSLTLAAASLILPQSRRTIVKMIPLLGLAAIATGTLISPYLYYALVYPERPLTSNYLINTGLRNLIIPPADLLLSYTQLAALAHYRVADLIGDWPVFESRIYLGPFLLFVVCALTLTRWRDPVVRLMLIALVIAGLMSLGPYRVRASHTIPLPWWLFWKLPLIGNAIPVRFEMYVYLVLAMMTAVFLESLKVAWQHAGAAFLSVLFLLPAVPATDFAVSSGETPAFFKSGICRKYLARDETVLVLPNPADAMLWQAQAGMYFRMANGWIGGVPAEVSQDRVEEWLGTGAGAVPVKGASPELAERLSGYISKCRVKAVIVPTGEWDTRPDLSSVLGVRPTEVGGVSLYRLPQRMLDVH